MSTSKSKHLSLDGVPLLEVPTEENRETVALFRRSFELDDMDSVTSAGLAIFADAHYHLWVNGTYLGRGPTFFSPSRMPVAIYDLAPHLRSGNNVIAVSALARGFSTHNHISPENSGLVARAKIDAAGESFELCTDQKWRVNFNSGWSGNVPKRSWAIGCIEHFDVNTAPSGWREISYDDSRWEKAVAILNPFSESQRKFIFPKLPHLCTEYIPANNFLGAYTVQENLIN